MKQIKVRIKRSYVLTVTKKRTKASQYGTSTNGPRLRSDTKLEYCIQQFGKDPNRRWVRKAAECCRQTGKWKPLGLVGLYLAAYENRYKRKWPGSKLGLVDLHRDMKTLHKRLGLEVPAAIEAVFSERMKWVSNQISLLLNRDAYAKHVVPVIETLKTARKQRGEQAEWEGTRSTEAACEEVLL